MRLNRMHWIGVITAVIMVIADGAFFHSEERIFFFLLGLGLGTAALPFIISFTFENRREQKINEMFLEFARNLAEAVATGTPVSKGIVHMKKKNFGVLNPYIQKLANQIEIGIPVERALSTFANDVDSKVVRRAATLINEAERSGGEIDYILESTAKSISEVEKLKKERKSAIYNLVVQGYIIFFVFIGIILVMEFKIIPLTAGLGEFGTFGSGTIPKFEDPANNTSTTDPADFARPLLYLLLSQGFFMGLVIGKLTEGSIKKGLKHSFILMITAFLVAGGAKLFFASAVS